MDKHRKWSRLARIFYAYRRKHRSNSFFPLRMWVELTNVCNLRCRMCPNSTDTTSVRGFMDLRLFNAFVAQAAGQVNDINLSHRGESLFHPDLPRMIHRAHRAGISTRLHTNAVCLTPRYSRELIRSRLRLLSFSFDGPTKEEYESLRIGGDYHRVLDNIYSFLQEKKRLGSRYPYTILQMIDMSDNSDKSAITEFADRFRGLPLDKFYVKKPHNWAGIIGGQEKIDITEQFTPCTFPWYSLTMLWDGTVVPCPQDWYGKLRLGHFPQQSLVQIWNSNAMSELRNRMGLGDVADLQPCCECDRIRRKSHFGIPTENMKAFIGETVAGYNFARKLIRR